MSPNTTPLVGEELVVEYLAYVDTLWAQNPARVRQGYAAHLNYDVTNNSTQRLATIADTDMVHPRAWVFRVPFIRHLQQQGRYSAATAHELGDDPAAAA